MKSDEISFKKIEPGFSSYSIGYNTKYKGFVLETIDEHQKRVSYGCICPFCHYWIKDWVNYIVAKTIDDVGLTMRCRSCKRVFGSGVINLLKIKEK